MKLAAIFNVWSDWDWLYQSTERMRPCVDGIIIVASEKSNYGEFCKIPFWGRDELYVREPKLVHPMHSETDKRNYGLQIAREQGYTHFIMMDADEFYDKDLFLDQVDRCQNNPNLAGLVCASQVYVKSPTLTIGLDTTLVPFIHKITPNLKHSFNRNYPFAWDKGQIKIDPTRSFNIDRGVEWSNIVMDHYSWVRSDIERKIRNSTAKANIERTNIRTNFCHLTEGSICEIYPGKPLVRVPNKYGLPEFDVKDFQPISSADTKL